MWNKRNETKKSKWNEKWTEKLIDQGILWSENERKQAKWSEKTEAKRKEPIFPRFISLISENNF